MATDRRDLDALVDSYAQRTELLARRRKLQAEVARAQKELAAMQCELQAIDTAIADSIAASPPASPHDGDASGHPRFSNGGGAKRNGEPSRPSPLGGGESPRERGVACWACVFAARVGVRSVACWAVC